MASESTGIYFLCISTVFAAGQLYLFILCMLGEVNVYDPPPQPPAPPLATTQPSPSTSPSPSTPPIIDTIPSSLPFITSPSASNISPTPAASKPTPPAKTPSSKRRAPPPPSLPLSSEPPELIQPGETEQSAIVVEPRETEPCEAVVQPGEPEPLEAKLQPGEPEPLEAKLQPGQLKPTKDALPPGEAEPSEAAVTPKEESQVLDLSECPLSPLPPTPFKFKSQRILNSIQNGLNGKELCENMKKHRTLVALLACTLLAGLLVGIGVYFYTLKSWDQEFLIIIGGEDGINNTSSDLISVFGLCNSNSIPPLPEGRRGGAAVTLPVSEFSTWSRHDGLEEIEDESVEALIYCGGIDNLNRVRVECWVLFPHSRSWIPEISLLWGVAFPAYASVQGKFLIAGGGSPSADNRLQIFSGGKWEIGSSLPSPWLASCGAGLLDYFLVLGGTRNQLNRISYSTPIQWKIISEPEEISGQLTGSCTSIPGSSDLLVLGDKSFHTLTFTAGRVLDRKKAHLLDIQWQPQMSFLNKVLIVWDGQGEILKLEKETWVKIGRMVREQGAGVRVNKGWEHHTLTCL
ncbi:uncharacterized protein LOC111706463 [Eurytemora carolleeae]|uniref:uncharacterized protein LOC111706463 n=1 Tax=Eurytemora carolleeae TaxID=1294199 RepID=UPI000C769708|nr:uncharacterized protein LOC111706463 [Eurytemora carolleeae]|eukprot:XP_023335114.1 uncharacterized protein LOC111706463 [Eurytemora affinis]